MKQNLYLQVVLFQKHSFVHQLIQNMTVDLYEFSRTIKCKISEQSIMLSFFCGELPDLLI